MDKSQYKGHIISLDQSKAGHYAKKQTCPSCNHKRFVRYYDFTDNEYLPDEYGRCDREENCGYFLAPYEELQVQDGEKSTRPAHFHRTPQRTKPEPKSVERAIVLRTLGQYETNNFVMFLVEQFGKKQADLLCSRFFIGTAKSNGTIFWQIDRMMRIRTGQKIHYDNTGHRIKDIPPERLFMLHKGYEPCLFGEHQLYTISDKMLICIVESEKTAIICSAYLPSINGTPVLWMAAGGVNGLTNDKVECLRGRNVVLVPDFSFHARATWGLVPMRKKPNDKGIPVPHPDGELHPDYVSVASRLASLGVKTRFFDPFPNITDSSDLADHLLTTPYTPQLQKPNLAHLHKKQTVAESHRSASNFEEHPLSSTYTLSGEFGFKITPLECEDGTTRYEAIIEPLHLQERTERILNHPNVQNLIKTFDICEGTISPLLNQ